MVKILKHTGKWVAGSALLASSLTWLSIVHWQPGNAALLWLYPVCNGLLGFFLGHYFDRVHATSLKDDLTQSYNRRFLTKRIPFLMAKTNKHNASLSITLIDCDDFKKINDEFGHQTGDKVLQVISRLLMDTVREEDYVVRWGGDEFLVIAEHSDHNPSYSIIDRLNEELKRKSVEMNMPLSVSVGTAAYPLEASRLEDLLRIADHKLYESKRLRKRTAVS